MHKITKQCSKNSELDTVCLVNIISLYKYNNNRFTAFVRDYPSEPVPEEIPTHHPIIQSLSVSSTIHSILPIQITCLAIFLHNLSPCPLVYLFVWSFPPHVSYISSPNQCLLFATHAHTITTCFAAVLILYHLFLVFLSSPYLGLYLLP